jgi:hypothetical protein
VLLGIVGLLAVGCVASLATTGGAVNEAVEEAETAIPSEGPASAPAEPEPPSETPSPEPEPEAPRTPDADVDWENYAAEVRTRIDALGAAGDCAGLQQEFDTAAANDIAQWSRTGSGNADLMQYIDEWLTLAGCYDRRDSSTSDARGSR